MKLFAVCLLFISGTMLGCAHNSFNIPAEDFAAKVKVLGVAPIFIDADSDINYPQKDFLLQLISDLNRKHEPFLIQKLRGTGNFYAVTSSPDEPRQLFKSLVARHEKRDDASTQYNKYFWKNDEIGSYIKKNQLDAVMVIVVSGLTNKSKIYSSNLMTTLETDYNFLMMTAQILGPDGLVLWEYPNFRSRILTYYPLINLQYPDFSESDANLSKKTQLRFKSIDGIRRTLEQKKSDWLFRETTEPEVYGKLFDEITSLIKNSNVKQVKDAGTVEGNRLTPPDKSVYPSNYTEKSTLDKQAPAIELPTRASAPESIVDIPNTATNDSNEIVPSTN